jgi:hypothetical protein
MFKKLLLLFGFSEKEETVDLHTEIDRNVLMEKIRSDFLKYPPHEWKTEDTRERMVYQAKFTHPKVGYYFTMRYDGSGSNPDLGIEEKSTRERFFLGSENYRELHNYYQQLQKVVENKKLTAFNKIIQS